MQNIVKTVVSIEVPISRPVELSLDQLQKVAGGFGPNDSWAVTPTPGPNDNWITAPKGPNDSW